jgi:hypothetical protein
LKRDYCLKKPRFMPKNRLFVSKTLLFRSNSYQLIELRRSDISIYAAPSELVFEFITLFL